MTITATKVFNSPTASATSKKTYSPQAMKLAGLLNERILKDPTFKLCQLRGIEQPNATGETNSRGQEKALYPDIELFDTVTGLSFDIEAMGEGSKSDDIDRHNWMLTHGKIPLYFENYDIDHAPHLVLREIRMKLKLLRLVCA